MKTRNFALLCLSTSAILFAGCSQTLDARKVRPGEIIGAQGLEREEIQKLIAEVNQTEPSFVIPKDGDSLTTRITFESTSLKEFDSTKQADLKCRFSYSEVLNKDTVIVTVDGDNTKYERTREVTPVSPVFKNVPNIQAEKDLCESEIELLNSKDTKLLDFSAERKIFTKFFNETLKKSLDNCQGQTQTDGVRCLVANFVRSESTDGDIPMYSLEINQGTVNENLDRVQYSLFVELSPKMSYFYPYGVFNLEGKLFAPLIEEFKGISKIRFEDRNF